MKVIICGGRDYTEFDIAYAYLDALHEEYQFSLVIQGEAKGADSIAKQWALSKDIAVKGHRANWDLHGRKAGFLRNKEMLDENNPDLVVAFPGGRGTAMMIELALKANVKVIQVPAMCRKDNL